MTTPGVQPKRVTLSKSDIESAARKFNTFLRELNPGEKLVMASVLARPELRGQVTHVIAGQADGILVTLGPHGIQVVGPIGPDTDPFVFPGEHGGG